MKKILALTLALCMVLALAACGGTAEKPAEAPAAEAPAAEAPAAEAPAAEAPAAEEPAAETDAKAALPDFQDSDLQFSVAAPSLNQDFEKDMVRGDDVQASQITNCPPTNDRASYQKDGRLQLISNDMQILFTIPFGWMLFTQDAMGQKEDYQMINDPAGLVKLLQDNNMNAVAITDNMEEVDMFVGVTGFSEALQEIKFIKELPDGTVKDLADAIKASNPGVDKAYFTELGNNIYLVLEFSQGYLFISVTNGIEFDAAYSPSNTTTQDDFNEVLDFLAGIEFSAA